MGRSAGEDDRFQGFHGKERELLLSHFLMQRRSNMLVDLGHILSILESCLIDSVLERLRVFGASVQCLSFILQHTVESSLLLKEDFAHAAMCPEDFLFGSVLG